MALTFGQASTRTSASTNPITTGSLTLTENEKVVVLLLKINGGTDRAGGSPTFGGETMTQANSSQKAVTSPEAIAEMWYLIDPPIGANTASIPNTGSLTIFYTLVTVKSGHTRDGNVFLDGSGGSNGTSANPTSTASVSTTNGTIGFAVCASGLTDFDPAVPSGTGFGTGTGTPLGTFDDGQHGGGQQYSLIPNPGTTTTFLWTVGSDDWGIVSVFFRENPTVRFNNYLFVRAGSGMSTTEKIR